MKKVITFIASLILVCLIAFSVISATGNLQNLKDSFQDLIGRSDEDKSNDETSGDISNIAQMRAFDYEENY